MNISLNYPLSSIWYKRYTSTLFSLTAAYVEGVVLVQRPPSQVGGDQLKSLHQSRPPLPLDDAGTRLVLVADRDLNAKTHTQTHRQGLDVTRIKNNVLLTCDVLAHYTKGLFGRL